MALSKTAQDIKEILERDKQDLINNPKRAQDVAQQITKYQMTGTQFFLEVLVLILGIGLGHALGRALSEAFKESGNHDFAKYTEEIMHINDQSTEEALARIQEDNPSFFEQMGVGDPSECLAGLDMVSDIDTTFGGGDMLGSIADTLTS